LLSELQAQVHESASKSSYQQLSLRRLAVWTIEPLERLKILAILVDACKGKRGGALASVVHAYANHGDPFIRSLVERVITQVIVLKKK
jgi:gamma-tubulin complex component 3